MGDDEFPRRIGWIVIIILFLLTLIPHIVGSSISYKSLVLYEDVQQVRPLTVNQLITLYAEKYEVDERLARNIISCESSFNPCALNVKAVIGEDVGLFQLNSHYWQETMALNGWDIYNIEDNIEAGMWLLSIEGSSPWGWSEHCWSKM